MHWFEVFLITPLPTQKLPPKFLSSRPRQKEITDSARQHSLKKSVSPNIRKGWRKLWFALSKFSQKVWRWLGTRGFLYFLWIVIFSNVMALQFCKYYLSYSMVLILFLLIYNHNNLILRLYQKKSYLDEGWLFTGSFKVVSVRGMINKEVLAQFIYKPT